MLMFTTSVTDINRLYEHKQHDKIEGYAIKTKTTFAS
jgi:hypothetical protein